jgi:HSP20 family protein
MLSRWDDIERPFAVMEELRRRMDGLFGELEAGWRGGAFEPSLASAFTATWPRVNLHDAGTELILRAEVPGLTDKDIRLTINQDVLTVEGERRVEPPKGYSVHRQERPSVRFARSTTLPTGVQADRVSAVIKNGMLEVTLPKVPEALPRQITVRPALTGSGTSGGGTSGGGTSASAKTRAGASSGKNENE